MNLVDTIMRMFAKDSPQIYWKATASWTDGHGSISKEWDSLGN